MANRRVLVKRRKSIRNIRKITRTMQLIATARFQAAYNRAVASRPYTEKLAELVADLSRAGALDHPLLTTHNPEAPPALVVVNSHRGLCGGYNSSVLRVAQGFLEQQRAAGQPADLYSFGKKGIAFFKFNRQVMVEQNISVADSPRFEQVEPTAKALIAQFLAGKVSAVHVAYMRFYSAGKQRPEVIQLLPLASTTVSGTATADPATTKAVSKSVEYEFSPDPESLLNQLLPATVRARLFQAFIDAAVSEQVARMAAMKAATDASEDMIKALTRKYNRARQSAITTELLDIVGGANALA